MVFQKNDIPWNKGQKGITGIWQKGHKFSDEHRKNISKSLKGKKGYPAWNKGKKLLPLSREHKEKLSIAGKNRKLTAIHKKKIGEALKGKKRGKAWNSGIKRTDIIGSKNGRWKGGITKKYLLRFTSFEWDMIRKLRLKMDRYRCQVCGIFKVKLDVHHIVPWRISHDDSLENLISVCRKCHKQLERGWKDE